MTHASKGYARLAESEREREREREGGRADMRRKALDRDG